MIKEKAILPFLFFFPVHVTYMAIRWLAHLCVTFVGWVWLGWEGGPLHVFGWYQLEHCRAVKCLVARSQRLCTKWSTYIFAYSSSQLHQAESMQIFKWFEVVHCLLAEFHCGRVWSGPILPQSLGGSLWETHHLWRTGGVVYSGCYLDRNWFPGTSGWLGIWILICCGLSFFFFFKWHVGTFKGSITWHQKWSRPIKDCDFNLGNPGL